MRGLQQAGSGPGVHALAVFAPGFFTGRLAERFGAERLVCWGALLGAGCVARSLGGAALPSFMGALALLGLGWNLMSTGATALLARAHGPADRTRAQAANHFVVFGAQSCAVFASGSLQGSAGWIAANLAVVPLVLA